MSKYAYGSRIPSDDLKFVIMASEFEKNTLQCFLKG